jgi:hypothetical protein
MKPPNPIAADFPGRKRLAEKPVAVRASCQVVGTGFDNRLRGIGVQSERELRSTMASVQNPTLFSAYFGVPSKALAAAGMIDPFLDADVPLFIDPVLLEKSSNKTINTTAIDRFRKHFEIFVRMLTISEAENDAAWKAARRQLDLREPPENGLGYGGSGRSGSSRPEEIREAILRTTKDIVTLGANDPEMISLMGFFEEDVGPDTISDMTTTVIMEDLAAITEAFCQSGERHTTHFVRFLRKPQAPEVC